MTWGILQFNYRFFFLIQCYDGVAQDKIKRTISKLRDSDNPSKIEGIFSCPVHKGRHVAKVIDSDLLLFFILYDDNHEPQEYRHKTTQEVTEPFRWCSLSLGLL